MTKHLAICYDIEDGFIYSEKYGSVRVDQCTLISSCPPNSYPTPDSNGIHEEASEVSNWIKMNGFPSTYSDKHEQVFLSSASILAFMAPTLKFGNALTRACVFFVFWMYTMDDVLDPMMEENKPGMSQTIKDAFKFFLGILNGVCLDPQKIPKSSLPYFEPMCNVLIESYKLFKTNLENFETNKAFFVDSTRNFLESFLWRYERENNGHHCSESTYIYFRSHYTGFYLMFELIAMVNGVQVSRAERENIEFIRYINACAAAMSVTNDILSLRKEIEDNQTENFAIHKLVNKNLTVADALQECVLFVNQETNEAIVYSKRILKSGAGDELQKYFKLINWSLEGHMRFYEFSKRYGKIKTRPITLTDAEYNALINPCDNNN